MQHLLLVMLGLGLAAGCQTQFVGDPHIDVGTCQARCTQSHLQMAGIVYMGEYSSACICEVPRPPGGPTVTEASGALGATAGVVMQMRASQVHYTPVPR